MFSPCHTALVPHGITSPGTVVVLTFATAAPAVLFVSLEVLNLRNLLSLKTSRDLK
jgi:hypothetical protein